MADSLRVECNAGYRGEETPRLKSELGYTDSVKNQLLSDGRTDMLAGCGNGELKSHPLRPVCCFRLFGTRKGDCHVSQELK